MAEKDPSIMTTPNKLRDEKIELRAVMYRQELGWPTKQEWLSNYRDGLMAYEVGYEIEEAFASGYDAGLKDPRVLALVAALEELSGWHVNDIDADIISKALKSWRSTPTDGDEKATEDREDVKP